MGLAFHTHKSAALRKHGGVYWSLQADIWTPKWLVAKPKQPSARNAVMGSQWLKAWCKQEHIVQPPYGNTTLPRMKSSLKKRLSLGKCTISLKIACGGYTPPLLNVSLITSLHLPSFSSWSGDLVIPGWATLSKAWLLFLFPVKLQREGPEWAGVRRDDLLPVLYSIFTLLDH